MNVSARLDQIDKKLNKLSIGKKIASPVFYDDEDNYYVGDERMTREEFEALSELEHPNNVVICLPIRLEREQYR